MHTPGHVRVLRLLAIVVCAFWSAQARADVQAGTAQTAPAGSAKQKALSWLDRYQKEQVLFDDREIARLRQKLADATPERAQQWLDETSEVRQILDGPEWRETRAWLKEFLKVQAIYSDEELEEFRRRAVTGSPKDLQKMLLAIEQQRATIAGRSADSARRRQQVLQINQAYTQAQFAQREAARRQARPATPTPRQAQPRSPVRPSQNRPPPLVDSLDVARWSVLRSIYPRW